MKRIDILDNASWFAILNEMLKPEEVNQVIDDVKVFYKHKHQVTYGVLNAALINAIIFTKNNGKGLLFNAAYLRKTVETFVENKVQNTAQAIAFMDKNMEMAIEMKKRVRVIKPDWLDEYTDNLDGWENSFEERNEEFLESLKD